MYRCYLIHRGRIAERHELAATTLEEAVAQGRVLLQAHTEIMQAGGIEIWQDTTQLYSDKCHVGDTGVPAPVASPFGTSESVTLPTRRRSGVRSLPLLAFNANAAARADDRIKAIRRQIAQQARTLEYQ
jgi:hypothetical protein